MNVIYKAFQDHLKVDEGDESRESAESPSKTVLGALTPRSSSKEPIIMKTMKNETEVKVPQCIEDIPFRRQDRRILNSRKKRIMDKKLIVCLNLFGLLILTIGVIFFALYFVLIEEHKSIKIFFILGPVIAAIGLSIMLFSIEICIRVCESAKRVKDPEIDEVDNLHYIKHWMPPEIIPYGWGQEFDKIQILQNESSDFCISKGKNEEIQKIEERSTTIQNASLARIAEPEITSDIFDESLRYDHVERPQLQVDPSSPVTQIRGRYKDEEDKIKNLFKQKT